MTPLTPLTPVHVTPMSNGTPRQTPRHGRQVSLRVTFADEYQGQDNCSVIYYCDVGDDVTADDWEVMTSDGHDQCVELSRESVKRSESTLSHDNPFALDGELQRKADFILQHSTISRHTLTIADPDQPRTVTETADDDDDRAITETADPGQMQAIRESVGCDQSAANGINYKSDIHATSGKEREQEPEVPFVDGFVSRGDGAASEFTVESRLRRDSEAEYTVANHHLGESNENEYDVVEKNHVGEAKENGSTVENRFVRSEEIDFTVVNRYVEDGVVRTLECPVGMTIELDGAITEAERTRQCCMIQ